VRFCVEAKAKEVSFSELCRRFGVSRPVGYKWVQRYELEGPEGLRDRSRAPRNHPHETPDEVVQRVLQVRARHPTWGPRKIIAWLHRHEPEVAVPVASTVGAILKRHGLVSPRRRTVRTQRSPKPLTQPLEPNAVWTMDFKGQFKLKGGPYCWPLTLMDLHSRYLLRCQALRGYRYKDARPVLEAAFREFGLPQVIRSDNGSPFACRGPGALSEMGVWFIRLGIRPERITPGRPQENGAHERMHRTLKAEATKPASPTLVAQQRRFNRFCRDYNEERPHEALDMAPPASRFTLSSRPWPRRLRQPVYPESWATGKVQRQGQTKFKGRTVYVGRPLEGLRMGFRQRDEQLWEVWLLDYCLGLIDLAVQGRLRPVALETPANDVPGLQWK